MHIACSPNHAAKPVAQSPRIERDAPVQPTAQQRREAFAHAYADGLTRAQRGDFAEALGAFEQALSLNPDSTDALISVGACHESIGDPIEAVRFYRRALALNPIEPDAYANLGTAYIKLYHRERNATWRRMAVGAWQRSLALKPDQPDVQNFLAREAKDPSQ